MKNYYIFMLKLNKKINIQLIVGVVISFFAIFLLNISESYALSPVFNQVKSSDSNTVYYLHHATGQRKAYINEAVFLDYGNNWSDVKVISREVLANWPEARLIKTADSDDLYYIEGNRKIKMNTVADIVNYNLEDVLPITVSQFELDQYETETTYQEAGLAVGRNLQINLLALQNTPHGLSLVAGTNDNPVLNLQLTAGAEAVVVNNLIFKIEGVYNRDLVDKARVISLADQKELSKSSSFSDSQLNIRFNDNTFIVPANSSVTIQIQLSFKHISNVQNQNLRLRLEQANSIVATGEAVALFPIIGPEFKFVEASNIVANVSIQENSLGSGANRQNLASFTISETSGQEDIYVRELVFRNNGNANYHDLEAFRLRRDNQVVSAAPEMNANRIVFVVNYLRIPAGQSVTLTIGANYANDYQVGRSVNLDLESAKIEGRTYELFLPVSINNLEEIFLLS